MLNRKATLSEAQRLRVQDRLAGRTGRAEARPVPPCCAPVEPHIKPWRASEGLLRFAPMPGDPNWTEVVTALATAVGALGLIGVAVQIRETRLGRDVEVTNDMTRRWDEDGVRNARLTVTNVHRTPEALLTALQEAKNETDKSVYYELLAEPNYHEALGVLWKRGALDDEIIREFFGDTLQKRWERWSLAVDWLRQSDAENYKNFQDLAQAMRDGSRVPLSTRARRFRRRAKKWLTEPILILRTGPR